MAKALIITEKPSVAGDIARVLGKFEKHKDYYENDDYVISHAVGHLLELKVPEGVEVKRGKWTLAALPVLPTEFELEPVPKTESQLKVLVRLLKRKDIESVINACDAGREGELIFRNIIRHSKSKLPIQRLWLQSMTPQSIRDAFTRLRSDDEMQPLSSAALSRAESDWLVGINSTRAFTAFNNKLIGGGFQKTTAGRVQTPTLAILVDREIKIRSFNPRTYFEVFADFSVEAGEYRGRWFSQTFKKGTDEDARAERIWDREQAEAIVARCTGKKGIVEEEKKPTTQAPPLLYDLTTLQREANQRFGLSAGRTLQVAQALYERHKVLTYPRTDSRYLPEDYVATAKNVLGSVEDDRLAQYANKALSSDWVRPNKRIFNNAKVSDHFAIVPTGQSPKNLDDFQMKIYEMILKRFIAVFYPAAQFEVTTRITRVAEDAFKTEGKIIKEPGWLAVYGKEAATEDSDKTIVPARQGEDANVERLDLQENQTKPPPRYSEATLLSAMEGAGKLIDDEELREAMSERGLGTPATRASIIEGLLKQEYIHRRGKELVPSGKGISLITLLKNLGAEVLTKPEMTGEWESKLNHMEDGKLSRDDFMQGIRTLTTQIIDKVKNFGEHEIVGQYQTLDVACPSCQGGPFKEDYRSWTCANCSTKIWKNLAGREFEPEEIRTLLTQRRIGPIDGFVSRMGRRFAAEVVLDENFKPTFAFGTNDQESSEPRDLSAFPRICKCPVCKDGDVLEMESLYACEHSQDGSKKCDFRTGRKILQRDIPREQVLKLAETGKTDLIAGFISKKGRPFKAYLVLSNNKVGFEFEERKKPAGKSKAA